MIDARGIVTNPAGFGRVRDVIGYVVHHSVTTMHTNASEADERLHIKTINDYHFRLGYGGFSYHAAAFPSGRVYQCGDLDSQRAHVKGRNHELIGVVAVGTFTDRLPAQPQLDAIQEALRAFTGTFGALPVRGHNQWALPGEGTACPGQLAGAGWDLSPAPPPLSELDFLRALTSAGQFVRLGWNVRDLAEIDKRCLRDLVVRMV